LRADDISALQRGEHVSHVRVAVPDVVVSQDHQFVGRDPQPGQYTAYFAVPEPGKIGVWTQVPNDTLTLRFDCPEHRIRRTVHQDHLDPSAQAMKVVDEFC
jgi:hypothetical protein